MYLRIYEVVLSDRKDFIKESDPIIYVRNYGSERAFTLDSGTRYGQCYQDARGDFIIVPDVWSADDADRAKFALMREW